MTPTPNIDRRTVLKTLGGAAGLGFAGGGLVLATSPAAASAELDLAIDGTKYTGDQGDIDWLGVELSKTILTDGFDKPLEYIGFKHKINIDANQDGWYILYDQRSGHLKNWSSDGDGSDGWGGPGEYVAKYTGDKEPGLETEVHADIKWAVISDGSHPTEWDNKQNNHPGKYVDWTDDLSEPDDGETNRTTVTWRTVLTFYTDAGAPDPTDPSTYNPVQITSDDGIPEVTGEDTFVIEVINEAGDTSGSAEDGSSTAE